MKEVILKTAEEFQHGKFRVSTGVSELDNIIGGIEGSLFYLFYGDSIVLSNLVHNLIVNCVMPTEKGGLGLKGVYFNNTNYYEGKTLIDPDKIGKISKLKGIDPKNVYENIYMVAAYNEERQKTITEKLCNLIEEDKQIRLIILHNMTVFLEGSKNRMESLRKMVENINMIWRKASEENIALITTAQPLPTRKAHIPKPEGGTFLRHLANIIVYMKIIKDSRTPACKAYLIKHPYLPQKAITFLFHGGGFMGRITPSFRQRYEKELEELKSFQNTLIDVERRKMFDKLLAEAWNEEQAAMGNYSFPTVLDALNTVANLQNRKLIEELKKKVEEQQKIIEELLHRIKEMEDGGRKDWDRKKDG